MAGNTWARAGKIVQFEGVKDNRRLAIIELPFFEKAEEWYHSDDYQKIKKLREGAAKGSLIAIEGC